jgi:membrane-associated phospholipid phosphatase
VLSFVFFFFGPPGLLPVWSFAFGWMNIIGVVIQIMFPNAPPWYQNLYGLNPAHYGMNGSAGGLARIDVLLGLNLYTGTFGASPQVFGAFPSLHSGSATMEALFMTHLFPQGAPLFFCYVMWIWWSTMYLTHHYFVDLIGGACLSFAVFYGCKVTILPRIQADKISRWAYDYVEFGVASQPSHPVKFRKSIDDEEYNLDYISTAATTPLDSDVEMGFSNEHIKTLSSPSGIATGLIGHRSGTPSPIDGHAYFTVRSASPPIRQPVGVTVSVGGSGIGV